MLKTYQKSLFVLALASSVFAAGCGGGSSGGDSASMTPDPVARNQFAGPLDVVQEPVSSQILAPLVSATAGTPLAGVVACVDQVLVGDAFDLVDSLAAQAALGGIPDFTSAAGDVQAEVTDLVADLQGLLTSLATSAGGGCNSSTVARSGLPTTNPLAGTPLEAFGATLLSGLSTAQGGLAVGGVSGLDLSALSSVLDQLSGAYQMALALVPAQASSAPVVGSSLTLVGQALMDLDAAVTAAASSGGDPIATAAAVTTTVENLLTGMLVNLVPVNAIEQASGKEGALSGPIQSAIDQLSGSLLSGLGGSGGNLPGSLALAITGVLAPLVGGSAPTSILDMILGPLTAAIGSGSAGGAVIPVTGLAALDGVLGSITDLLSGAGSVGSPLGGLIGKLQDLLGGLLG